MGKLLDKLNQVADSGGPRLGFAAGNDDRRGHIGIVAILPSADKELATAAVANGADALVVMGKKTKALGDGAPVGTMGASGGDFVVLTLTDAFGDALDGGDVDVVLSLEADVSDDILRSIEALPIDAVSMAVPTAPSSLQDLLPLYRTARSTRKPLLARVPAGLGQAGLIALRDAGADALVVEVSNDSLSSLSALRDEIAALPLKRSRSDKAKPSAALGLSGAGGSR